MSCAYNQVVEVIIKGGSVYEHLEEQLWEGESSSNRLNYFSGCDLDFIVPNSCLSNARDYNFSLQKFTLAIVE